MSALTLIHVVLSLVGIGSGLVVVAGLLTGNRLNGWTSLFLTTTVATDVTGYFFPFHQLMPSHIVGAISLAVLAVAIAARYPLHMAGAWRRVYVVCAALALYLNVFVGVVQAFLKIPALKALAPTQKETPFLAAQIVVLLVFVGLTILAARHFHTEPVRAMSNRGAA
jgi:hypothetical protein